MSALTPTMPSTVYLCRHGQTEWNVLGRRQGQLDSPLTKLEGRQAEAISSTVLPENIDAVFVSPLARSLETARIIATGIDRPISILEDLAEVHHGRFAGMTNHEIERRFPGQLEERESDKYTWRFPEGESYADVDRRSARALGVIAGSLARRPLVVGHEMITRMLLKNTLGLTTDDALSRALPHGTVLEINTTKAEAILVPPASRGQSP